MEEKMVVKIGDSLLTAFGLGTTKSYEAVKAGQSCLGRQEGKWELPEPFIASFIEDRLLEEECRKLHIGKEYTRFEQMAIIVANEAIRQAGVDPQGQDVRFILSTTKGNVDQLGLPHVDDGKLDLPSTASRIARWFGNPNKPITVSNACISGLHAQIEAWRILRGEMANIAIILAADTLSPFVVSGFQVFRAASEEPCRPFDEERLGLNLGEAAACAIYKRVSPEEVKAGSWVIGKGAVYNDAYHISHPSRTAEGSFRALKAVAGGYTAEDFAMVNVHGTATLYNDEMESTALYRAGLSNVPINSLKGYFGHTMGATGLLETLITMRSLEDGTILGTKGYHAEGVSHHVDISEENRPAKGKRFIKLISGFGGCNAAVRYEYVQDP